MLEPIRFEKDLLEAHLERIRQDRPFGHFRLEAVDSLIGGLRRGRLVILSAEPATGKTTLIGQLADEAASKGFVSVIATQEISPYQWLAKSLARISKGTLRVSDIADESRSADVAKAAETYRLTMAPSIVFLEQPMTAIELSAAIAKLQTMTAREIILFYDYLQIMPSACDSSIMDERLAVKEAVSGLRRIANVYDIPVFAISSINRTNYGKANPDLGALGGTAAIEYSADCVLHLSVEGKGDERLANMELPVRPLILTTLKNRYAAKGTAKLSFDTAHATFIERS